MHNIYHVSAVRVVRPYVIEVTFTDGFSREVDLGSVLTGQLYGPLRDPVLFQQVTVDQEVQTVVWPNGADFDPATLHDWPQVEREFGALARSWQHTPA